MESLKTWGKLHEEVQSLITRTVVILNDVRRDDLKPIFERGDAFGIAAKLREYEASVVFTTNDMVELAEGDPVAKQKLKDAQVYPELIGDWETLAELQGTLQQWFFPARKDRNHGFVPWGWQPPEPERSSTEPAAMRGDGITG